MSVFDQFSIPPSSRSLERDIQHKIDTKTKPPGSLGVLEVLTAQLAKIQNSLTPSVDHAQMIVFAADHGIVDQGVSAFPQEVTPQMVGNFLAGGAAVSVFCKQHDVALKVVDVGVNADIPAHPLLASAKVAYGSKDFMLEAAMSSRQLEQALVVGVNQANAAIDSGVNLMMFGEMGIGNTCVASCMLSALTGMSGEETAGRGTGLSSEGVSHKAKVIQASLKRIEIALGKPMASWSAQDIGEQCGGFEIIAMAGAMLQSAQRGVAFVVDGFICTAAYAFAMKVQSNLSDYAIFAHQSNETAHQAILQHLNVRPVLTLDLRLGEGSGAILAYPIIKSATVFMTQMASFADAGVSDGQ
ncbi:nicotinate-nucleotide--dimethylbenzimidazole phosphoribosyltransferase [Marinomonas mediterranea]|uniref:nicotinate-nucleotide--dimethylbenzimidazole phosphoribosyltransferase n=1 Tax=Marinomonas mediterranea TaxID=119864 RepID=UPI00234B890B|nr:nicotinate-nucleotide--dimethylbenzimidazole phosphoribosyltransferase [Marinomonas mediterranea]WCN10333.1 nicotinate-nucleotide--dimethylbenzimidazole phosphoribosyltransferase [Marinomonas mediterranea]